MYFYRFILDYLKVYSNVLCSLAISSSGLLFSVSSGRSGGLFDMALVPADEPGVIMPYLE